MLGAAADHPEDGPADEQPGATETQVHGEDEGGVRPRPAFWNRIHSVYVI